MRLTKHHGLGNDFLVVLDAGGDRPILPAEARRLCDRRTGVGADGVIRASPEPAAGQVARSVSPGAARERPASGSVDAPGAPGAAPEVVARMEILNADGSRAEMSGNGIRCLAQALVLAGWATGVDIPIVSDAGLRAVRRGDDVDAVTQTFAVDMGSVRIGADAPEWAVPGVSRAVTVDVGNPHLVLELVEDPAAPRPDLAELGELANAKIPGGMNVHLLRPLAADAITVRTYERGVGPTLACGTGACAAAAAAHRWGLTGGIMRVAMPGGDVEVTLSLSGLAGLGAGPDAGSAGDRAVLRGPATFVAAIDTDPPGAMSGGDAATSGGPWRDEEAPCR